MTEITVTRNGISVSERVEQELSSYDRDIRIAELLSILDNQIASEPIGIACRAGQFTLSGSDLLTVLERGNTNGKEYYT